MPKYSRKCRETDRRYQPYGRSRDRLLAIFVLSIAALVLPARPASAQANCTPPLSNPIVCENAQPGNPSTEWDITTDDQTIQGFATDISVNRGGTVTFKINTPASAYQIRIYRLGYYDGFGARWKATVTPSATLPQTQPACIRDATTGLVDCGNWAASASWAVPSDATSGVYIAKLVRSDTGGASHIVFIVRDDAGQSDLLYQTSDTRWQAYNTYGGASLYSGNGPGRGTVPGRAYKVSYNRPVNTRSISRRGYLFNAEYAMIRWLEANGYHVSYASGIDTDRRGVVALQQHRVFLSVGHDEYWSGPQRANVEAARNAGVHLAFFSGNEVFWKTRWETSIDGSGTPYRTLVCYKETHEDAKIDPSPEWTGTWRDPRFSPPSNGGRPENALTGTIFTVNVLRADPIEVRSAEGRLRFWRNTTLSSLPDGTSALLPAGVLGHEWDEALENGFQPPGLIHLSTTTIPVISYILDHGSTYGAGTATHHLTLYRHSSGALVFGAGTINWSWGLDATHDIASTAQPDLRMQQATVNLFADMGATAMTLQDGLVAGSPSSDTVPPTSIIASPANGQAVPTGQQLTVSGTATDAGGGVPAAVEISFDDGATWRRATGAASWTATFVATVPAPIRIRTRAVDDSGWLETPGPGITVNATSDPLPPTATLSADRQTVVAGAAVTLSWSTTRATTVSIDPGIGQVSASGSRIVTPTSTTTYTLTATNQLGSVSSQVTVTVLPPSQNGATFVRTDTTTQGNWIGAYGVDGYSLAMETSAVPGYAQVALSGHQSSLWSENTTDVRALRRPAGPTRFAATWDSSTSFTIDVNLTDGQSHQIALYVLDWDNRQRAQTIEVFDAVTDALLDSRAVGGFQNGRYLVWQISGHVRFRIELTSALNAVVSGIFFGGPGTPPSAATLTFSSSPNSIIAGQSSTLSWTSTDATSVGIDQGIGAVPLNGSVTVTPRATTTYTLTATNGSQSAFTRQATVTVTPTRIMPMGDSITQGLFSTGTGGYRFDLYHRLIGDGVNVDFVGTLTDGPETLPDRSHQGYPGKTINDIRDSLGYWFSQNSPDVILLMAGTNDVLQQSDEVNMPSRLSALIDEIYSFRPNAIVIVGTPIRLTGAYANRNHWITDYNQAIPGIVNQKAAQGRNIHFADIYPAVDASQLVDDIHPNDAGYSNIASVWLSKLREVLGVGSPGLPVVSVAATDATAAEPADPGQFTITRSGATTSALLVNYTIAGSASPGSDYALIPASLTIPAGAASATVAINVMDDSAIESPETVTLTISAQAAYAIGSPPLATVTLTSDDVEALPGVSVTATDATAGEPANPGQFTITRSGATTSALLVNYTISGSASPGSDYTLIPASLTIPAGAASATVPISVMDDSAIESPETVTLTISAQAAYTIGSPSLATVTLTSDDVELLPVVSVTASDATAGEPANPGQFTITRTGATTSALIVGFSVSGSASNGSDYALIPASLTIPVGAASATVPISVTDDSAIESPETVSLTLTANAAYTVGSGHTATVTITSEDTAPPNPSPGTAASFVRVDSTIQGSWKGKYGFEGYQVANDHTQLPAYANVTLTNAGALTWTTSTTELRSLQRPVGNRIASAWYHTSQFSINLNLTDGQPHQVALYLLDWDGNSRVQTISIYDAATNALLDSRQVSQMNAGYYVVYHVRGAVRMTVVKNSGPTAVVTGLFIDPVAPPPTTAEATLLSTDSATQGNWKGRYGSQGHHIANDTMTLPASAALSLTDQWTATWTTSTTEARALQRAVSGRVASRWYQTNYFSLNLNVTDGAYHQVALYFLDWDNTGRTQTVEIADAANGATLDVQSLQAFTAGKYLVYRIRGPVNIRITRTAGATAILNAVFLGGDTQ